MRSVPSPIGPFKLRALLHEEPGSALYDGFDPSSQRPVLIQVFVLADPRQRDTVTDQAKRLARVRHAAVAKVEHVGVERNDVFIVYARPEGTTLASLLAARRTRSLAADAGTGLLTESDRLAIVASAAADGPR